MSTISMSEKARELSLEEYLQQASAQRHANYEHTLVSAFPPIRQFKERVVWGSYSWSLSESHIRLVKRSTAVYLGNRVSTIGDGVRDYLDYYYPRRLRASGRQAEIFARHRAAPLLLKPGILKDGTYVDIKSTYWSILMLLGWDVDYYPGKWLIPGRIPRDFPLATTKAAYASLVSLGLPSKAYIWTGDHFIRRAYQNPHLNRGLWTLVQDILHSIAQKAEALDARYVHTDGYIIPSEHRAELDEYIATWGLPCGIKGSGPTVIFGFGNFVCGDKRTKRLRPILSNPYRQIDEIPHRKWLHNYIWKRSFRMTVS